MSMWAVWPPHAALQLQSGSETPLSQSPIGSVARQNRSLFEPAADASDISAGGTPRRKFCESSYARARRIGASGCACERRLQCQTIPERVGLDCLHRNRRSYTSRGKRGPPRTHGPGLPSNLARRENHCRSRGLANGHRNPCRRGSPIPGLPMRTRSLRWVRAWLRGWARIHPVRGRGPGNSP